jgi:pimeloyl-ACP methyl ester carboxylesterase
LAAVVGLGVLSAVVCFGRPDLILLGLAASARRSAGLERRTIEVGSHEIVYLEGGNGPAVVLLHGFGASKDLWNTVAGHLTPTYRVIVPDLPGFGESPSKERQRYDAENQALRVRAFLDALSIRDHHLGGNSMGGAISTVYAAKYPEAVKSLLIGAAPGVRSPEESEFERRLEAGENPMLVRNEADFDSLMELAFFRPPSIPGPLKRAMLDMSIRNRDAHSKIFDDFTQAGWSAIEPLLPRIQARTLVVWGEEDRIVHPSSASVFAAGIAGSEVAIFEECGHALPRECPELLVQRYASFLESGP